jgi:type IV pilus assembly protein PilW
VIGLILIAGVLQVFVGSTITYSMQSGLSKIQENGRFAISFLSRDIRQAGFTGCSRNAELINALSVTIPSFLSIEDAIFGEEGDKSTVSNIPDDPDSIEIKFVDPVSECQIESHDKGNERFGCTADHSFNQGDVLIATDCAYMAIFQFVSVGASDSVFHGEGGSISPNNKPNGIGYQYDDGSIMKMQSYKYYIANTTRGDPSLYRAEVFSTVSGGVLTAGLSAGRELVEGVENMQVLYGVDSDNDGMVNYYAPFSSGISDDIISVRVSLLIRSIENTLVQNSQELQFGGRTVTFNDGRLRKVFTSTIALRNRL